MVKITRENFVIGLIIIIIVELIRSYMIADKTGLLSYFFISSIALLLINKVFISNSNSYKKGFATKNFGITLIIIFLLEILRSGNSFELLGNLIITFIEMVTLIIITIKPSK